MDGILDGEEDGGSQEKGWFSNSLGCIDGLLVGTVPEQGHPELRGDAAKGRNLVGARAPGVQGTFWGVEQLLHGEETQALDKCPLHLQDAQT